MCLPYLLGGASTPSSYAKRFGVEAPSWLPMGAHLIAKVTVMSMERPHCGTASIAAGTTLIPPSNRSVTVLSGDSAPTETVGSILRSSREPTWKGLTPARVEDVSTGTDNHAVNPSRDQARDHSILVSRHQDAHSAIPDRYVVGNIIAGRYEGWLFIRVVWASSMPRSTPRPGSRVR